MSVGKKDARSVKDLQDIHATEGPEGVIPYVEAHCETIETAAPLFADVAALLADGLEPERPTVARVTADRCLFYAGRVNEIHGEPAVGKTNILLATAAAIMRDGGHVVFLDPEDNARGIVRRLVALGCNQADAIARFHYVQDPDDTAFRTTHAWVEENAAAAVILDGLAEALASEGKDENSPSDVLGFIRDRIRPFTDAGAAAIIADPVVKNPEARGRYARGSGAKLGRYDGVSYEAQLIEGYSPTMAGAVRLKVSKDRNGGVGIMGEIAAELHFTPMGTHTQTEWKQPDAAPFRPTALMGKIVTHLRLKPDASLRELRSLGGKANTIDLAIDCLVDDGALRVEKNGGGKSNHYVLQ